MTQEATQPAEKGQCEVEREPKRSVQAALDLGEGIGWREG